MVGTSPEQLESSVCERLKPQDDPLERDISQFLLLHHDYAAKPQDEPTKRTKKPNRINTKSKLKKIRPKIEPKTTIPSPNNSEEVIYGTYDEKNNCITIIVSDDSLKLDEAVTEVASAPEEVGQYLSIPGNASPSSPGTNIRSDSSDCGYESLDSPHSFTAEKDVDMWDESMSELFPSLI